MKRTAGLFILFGIGISGATLQAQPSSQSVGQERRALLLPPIAMDGGIDQREVPLLVPPFTEFRGPTQAELPKPIVRGAAEEQTRPGGLMAFPAVLTNLRSSSNAESSVVGEYLNGSCEHHGCFYFGGSFYLLRPFSDSNVAFRTTTGLGTITPHTSTTNFGWPSDSAFAVWLGFTGESGLGSQARWFRFDQASNTMQAGVDNLAAPTTSITPSPSIQSLPIPPGGPLFSSPGLLLNSGVGQDRMTFDSRLQIDAIDVEASYAWDSCNWHFLAGVGGRFLRMQQSYDARLTNALDDGVTREDQALNFTHNFSGGGPLFDLQAVWKIGKTNLGIYSNLRAALLVGRATQSTTFFQNVNDPNGLSNGGAFPVVTQINPSVSNITSSVMPIVDLEVGLEYSHTIGRARWVARSAVVNQTYFGAGNASRADGNLSLFGFQASVGLDY